MALPHGALDALLSDGGAEAFDKVIADDRAATQKTLNTPTVAKNAYNESRPTPQPKSEQTTKNPTTTPTKDAPESEPVEELPLDLVDTPIESLRAIAGTTRPTLPTQYAEMWSQDLEHGFLQFGIHSQLPSTVMQNILDFYAETSIVSAGQTREWAIEQFHRKFSSEVPREVRDLLVEFWTKEILGDSGEGEK